MNNEERVPILVVDDRPENLIALEALISDMDLDITRATSGEEALRQVLKADFALILLDVQMPGMNGFEAAELMRANPKTSRFPIIFVTAGLKEEYYQFKGYETGAVDYLTKPIEPILLQSKVSIFCELYRQRHQLELHEKHLESLVAIRTEALSQSEARFRRLHETMRDAFVSVNMQGKIEDANTAFEEMLGYSLDDLRSKYYQELSLPHWHAQDNDIINDQVLTQGFSSIFEKEFQHSNTNIFPVELRTFLIRDDNEQPISYWSIVRDITERKHQEQQLKTALRDKEILLKEVYHRVKNNFQVVSSLLTLQSQEISDPSIHALFEESANRIKTMALVHQQLYQSKDLSNIAFDEYLGSLIEQLKFQYAKDNVIFTYHTQAVLIGLETAIPCGLIINELLVNAIKHAFPDARQGRVNIEFTQLNEEDVLLVVEDDGIGLPEDFEPMSCNSLGWRLISGLILQIDGELNIIRSPHSRFEIAFKLYNHEAERYQEALER